MAFTSAVKMLLRGGSLIFMGSFLVITAYPVPSLLLEPSVNSISENSPFSIRDLNFCWKAMLGVSCFFDLIRTSIRGGTKVQGGISLASGRGSSVKTSVINIRARIAKGWVARGLRS